MWDYTDKVRKLYQNPKNVGSIPDADGVGEVGSIVCGDALRLYIKVNKKTNIITDAKFQTFGCGSAIASSSAMTEMVKGKTIEEASKLTNEDIVKYLGGLPLEKMHCSVMGYEALQKAILDYKGENLKLDDKSKIICKCFVITEDKIKRVIEENNLHNVDEVTAYTKAGGNCGKCKPDIEKILKTMGRYKPKEQEPKKKEKEISALQLVNKIQEVIENEIRPSLQKDGGDIELVDIKDKEIIVRLEGTCRECPASEKTLTDFVQTRIRQVVSSDITVREV